MTETSTGPHMEGAAEPLPAARKQRRARHAKRVDPDTAHHRAGLAEHKCIQPAPITTTHQQGGANCSTVSGQRAGVGTCCTVHKAQAGIREQDVSNAGIRVASSQL